MEEISDEVTLENLMGLMRQQESRIRTLEEKVMSIEMDNSLQRTKSKKHDT